MDDLFRGLFGTRRPPPGHPYGNSGSGVPSDDGGDGDDSDDGFVVLGDFDQIQNEMMQQMEDMMRNLFHGGVGVESHPLERIQKSVSPRDQMLKEPDEEPEHRDQASRRNDETHRVTPFADVFRTPRFDIPWTRSGGFDRDDEKLSPVIQDPSSVERSGPRVFSQHKSVSVRTIRGADGRVEQHRTVRRSDGVLEETVTRTLGDKSHTCTTQTDDKGVQQKMDTFTNMEHKDLSGFNDAWNKGRQPSGPVPYPAIQPSHSPSLERPPDDGLSPRQPNITPKDGSLLQKIFDIFKPKS